MIPADETFDGTFPFAPHFSSAPGFRMHYVDEGAGPVLLFLHGEPTWGYLFRHAIQALSGDHRVVVPDHMGFGKSETPAERGYRLQDHIDNLEALVLDLGLREITLVMHDFGGGVGMGLLARRPELISRIVAVNAPVPFDQAGLGAALSGAAAEAPWFRWVLRAEKDGTLDDVLGELGYNILSTLKLNGFQDNSVVTPTWIRAYGTPFPTPESTLGARGWAKGFALGQHVFEAPTADASAMLSTLPALAIWGMEDRTLDGGRFLPLFREIFPGGAVVELPGVGHYSFEDAPSTMTSLLRLFLQMSA